jgi:pimeloyl-ACP methyl ester carboxylesterase
MRINSVLLILFSFLVSACGEKADSAWIENKYMSKASRFVEVDGNRVHYRDEGKGRTVILIHGTASSLHTWDQWSEHLKGKYRLVRMDLPGFGLTGPDRNNRYEVSDDIRFISKFLATIGVERADFVGSSLGGRVAWEYALKYPRKVRTLTLMNALGYPQEQWPPAIEMAQWPIIDKLMEYVSPKFMFEEGLKEVYFEERLVSDELVDRYYELSRYPGNMAAFPKRVQARLDHDASQIVKITVPTLIMWGEEDKYFPVESAYRFKKDIPNAKLHVYPMVGHLPMEEVPQLSSGHVDEFISRTKN